MSERPTSCIICSINCGLRVKTAGRRIAGVRGDPDHPASRGYLCEKAQALDHYQNGRERLTSPLRRRADGTFEPIDWDTAIYEVALRFAAIAGEHGGRTIFHYGGGGQANHLGGGYGRAVRAALGSVFTSNALAQEKTGEFWVDGQLFGRERCHTCPDFEHAEVAVLVGKNPWHSHGFHRARAVLKAIAKDPARALIVIDPRRTETAAMASLHLQVRPGGDAWLLAAMVALLLRDGAKEAWLREHTHGLERLRELFASVDVAAWCARAGVPEPQVRAAVRLIASAESVSVLEDLGIQQAPHSTLSSWLEKLLYLLTGNFAKKGGMNLHSHFASLGGGKEGRKSGSPVGGHRLIGGLVPCNAIAGEILGDHPARFRAMLVESANPAYSLADSQRFVEALRALELLVVIDVQMTETAAEAHYVLPASSQFEKWEAAFFNLEFPENVMHLRAPLFEPLAGTLPEAEIHTRLVKALGALDGLDLEPLRAAAREGLDAYAVAFMSAVGSDPRVMPLAPAVLHETMGPALPPGAEATSIVWALAQQVAMNYPDAVRRAGIDGPMLGNALFRALLERPSGIVFTKDDYPETWSRVETPDKRVRLVIEELVPELQSLADTTLAPEPEWPFVLAAGERRTNTANSLFRDPSWRKQPGTLRMSLEDAARLGLAEGAKARITTRRGSAIAPVEPTDTLRAGHATLPNGHGIRFPDGRGKDGVAPNDLTALEDRDPIAGTPWHKHVRARIEPV